MAFAFNRLCDWVVQNGHSRWGRDFACLDEDHARGLVPVSASFTPTDSSTVFLSVTSSAIKVCSRTTAR
jgi:hypothetical protein